MNRAKLTGGLGLSLIGAALAHSPTAATAAVLTNPATFTGANAIDPPSGATLNVEAVGSTPQATLEARTDFQAVQDFTGFEAGAANTNFVSFTDARDATLPDLRFNVSGSGLGANAGAASMTDNRLTSAGTGISLVNTANNPSTKNITLTIDFGLFDDASGTFNQVGRAVDAAALTVGHLRIGQTATVSFFSDTDLVTPLATQTHNGTTEANTTSDDGNGIEVYFGFASDLLTDIGQIRVTRTYTGLPEVTGTVDDIGFTAIVPEPSTLAGVAVGAAGLLARRRRAIA